MPRSTPSTSACWPWRAWPSPARSSAPSGSRIAMRADPKRSAHRRRRQLEVERFRSRAAAVQRLLAGLSEAVEDREAVALRVVQALLGEEEPRPDEDLEVLVGLGDVLDERILELAHDVADRVAGRESRVPARIVAAGELEERVVRRPAVEALDEWRELRGDPAVHLDDL